MACAMILVAGCGGSGSGTNLGQGPVDPPDGPPQLTQPTVATIDPDVGPPAGGTTVTVHGTGFKQGVTGAVTVSFGSASATQVAVLDDQTLTCVAPEGAPEAEVDIVVTNSRGTGRLVKGYSYLSMPSVSSDLNDDGVADLVIAAQLDASNGAYSGSVYVFYGVTAPNFLLDMSADAANVKLMGVEPGDRFGSAVTSGDLDGDGSDDLVVGASGTDGSIENVGSTYVFFGPLPESGMLYAQQADLVLVGSGTLPNEYFGSALSVGDVDGDFLGDLLVGAPGVDVEVDGEGIADVGAAYVFLGSGLQSGDALLAAHTWVGVEPGDALGGAVLLADLDGDESSDVVIGASLSNPVVPPKKYDAGSVHVYLGGEGLSGGTSDDADVVFSGEMPTDEFGTALASGDVNGDGIEDLMVTAPGSHALGSETGRAYVFLGSTSLVGANAADATAIYSGQQSNADFGRDVTTADMNGDGFADVSIGAPHNSFGANRNGRCYVFLGSQEPVDGLAHFADVIYTGELFSGERFGYSLEVIDLDGNDLSDTVSGAVGNDGGGASSGRVYVFEGSQTPVDTVAADDDLTLTGESDDSNFGSTISRGQ